MQSEVPVKVERGVAFVVLGSGTAMFGRTL